MFALRLGWLASPRAEATHVPAGAREAALAFTAVAFTVPAALLAWQLAPATRRPR